MDEVQWLKRIKWTGRMEGEKERDERGMAGGELVDPGNIGT